MPLKKGDRKRYNQRLDPLAVPEWRRQVRGDVKREEMRGGAKVWVSRSRASDALQRLNLTARQQMACERFREVFHYSGLKPLTSQPDGAGILTVLGSRTFGTGPTCVEYREARDALAKAGALAEQAVVKVILPDEGYTLADLAREWRGDDVLKPDGRLKSAPMEFARAQLDAGLAALVRWHES